MNLRDMVLIVAVAVCTSWAIEYFMGSKKPAAPEVERSGQAFVAPKTKQEFKPLITEVDFVDTRRSGATVATSVETQHALYDFSTEGAALERLRFKRQLGDTIGTIATIFPSADTERENRCFLVALADKTPFFYTLVERVDSKDTVDLVYEAETSDAVVRKVFTIYQNTYQIDLALTVRAKHAHNPVEPRIIFPAPLMPDILDRDVRTIMVSNESGSLTKIKRSSLTEDKGWFAPTFFGTDSLYFVQAMVHDNNHFTKRAYSKVTGPTDLFAILEGPSVQDEQTWKLSFYFGPKELAAMGKVDPLLEKTFDYAWFLAPIAKFLLALLVFFNSYLGNYGFAIIALTIAVRLLLLPFAFTSTRSMNEGMKKSAEMQRKLSYIQQRYKDNPEQLALEREELIRKHGLPGLGGCVPLLLQVPVFIALSSMISNSIQLYRAPFVLWIDDLSARDPYLVLPALVGGAMLVQAFTTADVKQRTQLTIMAFILAAVSSYWSSGLCLYLLVSTALGVGQTTLQKKLGWA